MSRRSPKATWLTDIDKALKVFDREPLASVVVDLEDALGDEIAEVLITSYFKSTSGEYYYEVKTEALGVSDVWEWGERDARAILDHVKAVLPEMLLRGVHQT